MFSLRVCLIMVLLALALTNNEISAAAPAAQETGQECIVQSGDWLSKLAEKYYGDAQAWPLIVEATNTRAATDSSFARIDNPDLIVVGQKR